jgi:hypothetical protein
LRGDHELTDSDPARDGPPELVSGRGPTSDSARPPSARPIDGSEDGQPVFAAPRIPGSTVRGARAVMLRVDQASPPLQARICPAGKRGPKWLGLDLGPLFPPLAHAKKAHRRAACAFGGAPRTRCRTLEGGVPRTLDRAWARRISEIPPCLPARPSTDVVRSERSRG